MERDIPKSGEFYKHFKGKLYQVLYIAKHTETDENLVIYQALYGEYKIFARPLIMFMSKVDKEKYPNVDQEYRFEKFSFKNNDIEVQEDIKINTIYDIVNEEEGISLHLMSFLDAKEYQAKKMILVQYKTKFTEKELECIYESLSINKFGGNTRAQVASLIQYLDMQEHYEGTRLR